MADHPLCCDCDNCINGSGGYVLPGSGATKPDPLAEAVRKVMAEERAAWRRDYARKRGQLQERAT